tara:strand:- start:1228 stop:1377 length:150 start_codon:yes stop_codon:yes gene_type:complete
MNFTGMWFILRTKDKSLSSLRGFKNVSMIEYLGEELMLNGGRKIESNKD